MIKKRHTLIVVLIVLAAICLIIITRITVYNQAQKAYIKESYYRQNVAFTIEDPYFRSKGGGYYRSYADVPNKGYLYAYLRLYERDTGCTVTIDDVNNYLSKEYNTDGTRRLSEQYPEIQGYIDYFWDCLKRYPQKGSDKPNYLSLYRISIRDGFMICNDMRVYNIRGVQQSDMDKAIEWAFNVSDEQKAEGYIFNTYDLSRGKTDLGTLEK